jgi:hypothetical protein
MIARRLILSTIVLASFGSACTLLVMGKIGDTGDYPLGAGPSGTSGSSGATTDECSLTAGSRTYDTDRDANACSECIATECKTHVEYACNRGENNQKKPWFESLSNCAKNPWENYIPPGSGASFYACTSYAQKQPAIAGEDEAAKKRASEICVHDKCLQGDLPACKLCEVHTEKTGTSERALLRDDPCGKCLVEGCPEVIIACCGTEPMGDFVEHCAYTNDPPKKALCKELGSSVPDSGDKYRNYNDAGDECLSALSACFKANCASKSACK